MQRFRFFPTALVLVAVLVPGAVASADAAALIVAHKTDDTVSLMDPSSGRTVVLLPTGPGPHEVVASADGRTWVVSNYGREAAGSTLTVVRWPGGRDVSASTLRLGDDRRPHGLAWLPGDRVAVTTEGSGQLLVVDPLSGAILKRIPTGQAVSHMVVATADGQRAFVANIGAGTITAIDLAAGRKLADIPTGRGAEGIALTPDGREVWVANREADTLTVVDAARLEVRGQVPCPGFPIRVAVTPDGKRVLVSCARSGELAAFDAAARTELVRRKLDLGPVEGAARRLFGDRFGGSPVPVGLVVAADGTRAYVAATQADVVVVVSPETLEVIDRIPTGREPDGLACVRAVPS
jgi:YVTN family beta-propeller protein